MSKLTSVSFPSCFSQMSEMCEKGRLFKQHIASRLPSRSLTLRVAGIALGVFAVGTAAALGALFAWARWGSGGSNSGGPSRWKIDKAWMMNLYNGWEATDEAKSVASQAK